MTQFNKSISNQQVFHKHTLIKGMWVHIPLKKFGLRWGDLKRYFPISFYCYFSGNTFSNNETVNFLETNVGFNNIWTLEIILSPDSGLTQNSTKSRTAQNKTKSQRGQKGLSPIASRKHFVTS